MAEGITSDPKTAVKPERAHIKISKPVILEVIECLLGAMLFWANHVGRRLPRLASEFWDVIAVRAQAVAGLTIPS